MALIRIYAIAVGVLVTTFAAAPANAAAPGPGTPEEARRAYDAGHFTDAMGIWSELSREGSPEAALGLGLLYDLGNGTPANPETAFFWYKFAADAGLPAAEFNVAAMYDAGHGVAQDSQQAAIWYAKAAAHGHARAQFDIAQLYEEGAGVPRNPDVAAAWMQEAAKSGIQAAAARLKGLTGSPRPEGPMQAVTLAAPARDASLTPAPDATTVELVWTAPAEPQPVQFEVQVRKFNDPELKAIFTTSVTTTSVVVPLPAAPDFYVWNVNAVAKDGSHAAGDWNWFSVGQPVDMTLPMAPPGTPQASR